MGISPTAPPRNVRDSLPSYGSNNCFFPPGSSPIGLTWIPFGCTAPSLPLHYRAFITTTSCSAPDKWPWYLALRRGSSYSVSLNIHQQVPKFRCKACTRFMPPLRRMPSRSVIRYLLDLSRLSPQSFGFDMTATTFDASSVVHFHSSP